MPHENKGEGVKIRSGPGKSSADVLAEARADHTKYEKKCADSKGHQGSSKRLGPGPK